MSPERSVTYVSGRSLCPLPKSYNSKSNLDRCSGPDDNPTMNTSVSNRMAALIAGGILLVGTVSARTHHAVPAMRVFVEPAGGFELVVTAALEKGHVPVTVVSDRNQADVEVGGSHSGRDAAVKLTDPVSGNVLFTYSSSAGSEQKAEQAAAQACAHKIRKLADAHHQRLQKKLAALLAQNPAFDF
jgi:hypothetical protein